LPHRQPRLTPHRPPPPLPPRRRLPRPPQPPPPLGRSAPPPKQLRCPHAPLLQSLEVPPGAHPVSGLRDGRCSLLLPDITSRGTSHTSIVPPTVSDSGYFARLFKSAVPICPRESIESTRWRRVAVDALASGSFGARLDRRNERPQCAGSSRTVRRVSGREGVMCRRRLGALAVTVLLSTTMGVFVSAPPGRGRGACFGQLGS